MYPKPARDWSRLIIGGAIVLAGIVVWNAWAFDRVASGGSLQKTTATTTPLFTSSSIDRIHTIFENRADEAAKYTTGVYRYADPSH